VFVTVVAARIPKVQAAPNGEGGAGGGGGGGGVGGAHGAEVVNVHTLLAARVLPNVSATPVVIVAVKVLLVVPSPGGVGGVKVAIWVATI
jgi:hypothetical protein